MANYQSATARPPLDPVFLALGDSTRRAIVHRLGRGPATVKELASPFPMALPSFMKHLGVLERSGLIRSRKHGRVRTCELEPAALHAAEHWIAEQKALWEARSDRLAAYAESLHDASRHDRKQP